MLGESSEYEGVLEPWSLELSRVESGREPNAGPEVNGGEAEDRTAEGSRSLCSVPG